MSEARDRQHKLFQELGTLYRVKMLLQNMARPGWPVSGIPAHRLTPLQQRCIDAAAYVVADVIAQIKDEMQRLPSKKNLKQQIK